MPAGLMQEARVAGAEAGSGIERALDLGHRLLASAEAAIGNLSGALDEIRLPPLIGTTDDQSRLRSVPPLYLASELEEARLLPAVEMLAGLYATGGLQSDPGAAAARLLVTFWEGRHERFSAHERQAFFAHLFGGLAGPSLAAPGGRNEDFESLMIDLTEALAKLGADPVFARVPTAEIPTRTAASQLAANLLARSGGVATLAARDLLTAIRQALDILKHEALQQAVGARTVWGAVQRISQLYLGEDPDIDSHVTRGKAGNLVLAWLAESFPRLDDADGGRLLPPGDPTIGAATVWLQASLTLTAKNAAPPAQGG